MEKTKVIVVTMLKSIEDNWGRNFGAECFGIFADIKKAKADIRLFVKEEIFGEYWEEAVAEGFKLTFKKGDIIEGYGIAEGKATIATIGYDEDDVATEYLDDETYKFIIEEKEI